MDTVTRAASLSSLMLVAALFPRSSSGQAPAPSVAEVLADYGRNASDPSVDFPSEAYPWAGMVNATLLRPDRYSPARVDSILDGLRLLASNLPTSPARMRATVELCLAGDKGLARGFAIVSRAREVYDAAGQAGDIRVQVMIIRLMVLQEEEADAIAFLESVARVGNAARAWAAIYALSGMGPRGKEALGRLDETDGVGDASVRDWLHRTLSAAIPTTEPPAQEVPAHAPDSIPSNLDDLAALLELDDGSQVSTTLLMATFSPQASQAERQAAIDGVGGRVIGGMKLGDDGVYLILVPGDGTRATIDSLADSLQAFPQVQIAGLYLLAIVN